MQRFDTGGPPSVFEHAVNAFSTFWMLPLAYPMLAWTPVGLVDGLMGHLVFFANGVCWGALLVVGWRRYAGRPKPS